MAKLPRDDSRERAFLLAWRQVRLDSEPMRDYRFHPTRKWELDFAWIAHKVGVEIQGGAGRGGKRYHHISHEGYQNDCDKLNAAILEGWRVLWFTSQDIVERPIQCAEMVAQLLEARR